MATIPPEIIQFILDYLDKRDLIKTLCLNWTWAQLVAPRLWQDVHFSANSNRIVFLITKSVQPPSLTKNTPIPQRLSEPDETLSSISPGFPPPESLAAANSRSPWSNSVAPNAHGNSLEQDSTLEHGFVPDSSAQDIDSTLPTSADVEEAHPPPLPKRRNSYPWPTLLPYHSMVHSLHVELSSADMLQDLIEIISCCNELRSFSIHSAIPTEDLLIRGVISTASSDCMDPLCSSIYDGQRHASSPASEAVASAASTSSASIRSRAGVGQTYDSSSTVSLPLLSSSSPLVSNVCLHVPRSPRQPSVSSEGTYSTFGREDGVGWNSPITRTKPQGILFSLLANACPKLEKLWFSGFHPITVLGDPTDLRPTLETRQHQVAELFTPQQRSDEPTAQKSFYGQNVEQPQPSGPVLVPPVPGMNDAATPLPQTPIPTQAHPTRRIPPSPLSSPSPFSAATLLRSFGGTESPLTSQQLQSRIHTLQFVNCTVPPNYLLSMIQYSLPELKELNLMQCWPQQPVGGSFLELLAQMRPGLQRVSIHGTQSHRAEVDSIRLLEFLKRLEGNHSKDEEYTRGDNGYKGKGLWKGGEGNEGGQSQGASHSGSRPTINRDISALAEFPLGTFGRALGGTNAYISQNTNLVQQSPQQSQQDQEQTRSREGSDLESIRVWFTHSILDEAIVKELSDRERHPRLQEVEFGSEDPFDVGEGLVARLAEVRPELKFCCWVNHDGDNDYNED